MASHKRTGETRFQPGNYGPLRLARKKWGFDPDHPRCPRNPRLNSCPCPLRNLRELRATLFIGKCPFAPVIPRPTPKSADWQHRRAWSHAYLSPGNFVVALRLKNRPALCRAGRFCWEGCKTHSYDKIKTPQNRVRNCCETNLPISDPACGSTSSGAGLVFLSPSYPPRLKMDAVPPAVSAASWKSNSRSSAVLNFGAFGRHRSSPE